MWEISSDPLDLFNIILIVDAARNYLVILFFELQLIEYSRASWEADLIQPIHDGFHVFHWTMATVRWAKYILIHLSGSLCLS